MYPPCRNLLPSHARVVTGVRLVVAGVIHGAGRF